jgi:hypothetical protein
MNVMRKIKFYDTHTIIDSVSDIKYVNASVLDVKRLFDDDRLMWSYKNKQIRYIDVQTYEIVELNKHGLSRVELIEYLTKLFKDVKSIDISDMYILRKLFGVEITFVLKETVLITGFRHGSFTVGDVIDSYEYKLSHKPKPMLYYLTKKSDTRIIDSLLREEFGYEGLALVGDNSLIEFHGKFNEDGKLIGNGFVDDSKNDKLEYFDIVEKVKIPKEFFEKNASKVEVVVYGDVFKYVELPNGDSDRISTTMLSNHRVLFDGLKIFEFFKSTEETNLSLENKVSCFYDNVFDGKKFIVNKTPSGKLLTNLDTKSIYTFSNHLMEMMIHCSINNGVKYNQRIDLSKWEVINIDRGRGVELYGEMNAIVKPFKNESGDIMAVVFRDSDVLGYYNTKTSITHVVNTNVRSLSSPEYVSQLNWYIENHSKPDNRGFDFLKNFEQISEAMGG